MEGTIGSTILSIKFSTVPARLFLTSTGVSECIFKVADTTPRYYIKIFNKRMFRLIIGKIQSVIELKIHYISDTYFEYKPNSTISNTINN
ncbi:hypothetical protein CANINC_003831 [Pichia inconspicua]|uniref:Uncharacterized protein n=1 Tax=Pichia inconspicua TaxID=52247 RepID=A0A4T0WXW9_9ASCO|nr:hypothetical protein CANINC_003831 [[Candida] inconspicua]